jgi:hypothetical protein
MIALRKTNGDHLTWKVRGIARPIDGDPRFDTDVGLCVYGPTREALLRATAPAGLACRERPCWSGSSRTGWVYRSQGGEHDGVVAVTARAGSGRLSVRARGASLVLPSLPASLPLTVQLQTGRGACWEAKYDAADVLENTPTRFVASDRRGRRAEAPGR